MKMKSLTIFLALTFSVMFASSLHADWTKATKNSRGTTFYADFDRIRKHDGYVYYWRLTDYAKPVDVMKGTFSAKLSNKIYNQGDCKLFRFKELSISQHKEPLGGGTGDIDTQLQDWTYPPPNAGSEIILEYICNL